MRALHLIKTSVGAGWALRQIRELVKLDVDIHVALPGGGPMVGQYAAIGAVEHLLQTDFPIRSPWKFPAISRNFLKLLSVVQPDILHSHFVGTTLSMRLSLVRANSIPRIFQVPGPLHLEHLFFRKAELATTGRMDYWIGSCRWTCARYEQSGIDRHRIFLSYYGTDIDTYAPKKPGKLRSELGLRPENKIVGMVAFMYAPKHHLIQTRGLKGHEDLIDAIKICLEHKPEIRCVIVGGAWNNTTAYEKYIRTYARQQCGDQVIFLGTQNDVADLYADFDVAVHPSHSENVGGAVESLLLGVPTIATRIGGFPDVVKDGETGWLVPPKDPQSLSQAILEVFNQPIEAKNRALSGQKLVRNLFDVKRTAAEIKSIYQKILSQA